MGLVMILLDCVDLFKELKYRLVDRVGFVLWQGGKLAWRAVREGGGFCCYVAVCVCVWVIVH